MKSNSDINRRSFFSRAALVGAGLAIGKIAFASSSDSSDWINTYKTKGK